MEGLHPHTSSMLHVFIGWVVWTIGKRLSMTQCEWVDNNVELPRGWYQGHELDSHIAATWRPHGRLDDVAIYDRPVLNSHIL